MNKKLWKKIVPIAVASLIVFSSCGSLGDTSNYIILTDENKDTVKYTTAKQWEYTDPNVTYWGVLGKDVMPLVGYWGPWKETIYNGTYIPDLRTDEMYAKIAETGCNLITQNNDFFTLYPEKVMEQLDLCQKYGLGYFVADNAPADLKHTGSPIKDASTIKMDQETFTAHFAQYATHPAYAGWYCVDEPAPQIHGSIDTVANYYYNALEELGVKNCPIWVNLFPMGYVGPNYGYDSKEYYREMTSAVGYLCYDQYPFQYNYEDNLTAGGFFANLNLAYEVTKEMNTSFLSFVATGGNWFSSWDDHKSVCPATIEQTVWEVNTMVAYGAKGIQYFTLNNPHSYFPYVQEFGLEEGSTGAFDMFGNKTKYFYALQMANTQILACDHILMNATHHGIISKGEMMGGVNRSVILPLLKDDVFRELTSVNDDATTMIGCFDYKGKTALYVMNSSYYEDTEVKLGFDDKYCYDVIQRGKQVSVVTKNLTLKLSPGEAVMVALR